MKKLSSLSLILVLMLSLLLPSAAAAEGLQAVYDGKTVTVTSTGLKADTKYTMISVRSASSVLGLDSGTTDATGRLEAEIPVGPLEDGTYEVHIYNNEDGTVAQTGSFVVGGVQPNPHPHPNPNPHPKPDPTPRPDHRPGTRPENKPSVSFDDVKPSDYYYDAVRWAAREGVTQGITATTFGPENRCTRAQSVTFLWRAAGEPEVRTTNNPFNDVKKTDYFYKAVLWAVEEGITKGTSETTFSPDLCCTRAQIVTFLWRAEDQPKSSGKIFADISADSYYADAVRWAAAEGITTGMSQTSFAPDIPCTRAQIVTFLYRAR